VQLTLGDGHRWGVNLHYAFDVPAPLGTGGALRKALAQLGEAFLVMYGDTYLPCDFAAVGQAFLTSGKLGLMTVLLNDDLWDHSNVLFQEGQIVCYHKQQRITGMQHIDYGLGALRAGAFDAYQDGVFIDLATIYQDLLARDQLAGFEVTQRFYEIGSYAGLQETRQYLIEKRTSDGLRATASC
jgi:NDP-sugar pyrophosphorylase family protein